MSAPGESPGLVLVPERLAVQVGGREVVLTPTQFRLLDLLVREPGRIFSRTELMEQGIGTLVTERTVDVHIKDLRRKRGPHGSRIETVRGRGYRFSGETPADC
jgi:two-component system phosphate regulon response regulator PhoB